MRRKESLRYQRAAARRKLEKNSSTLHYPLGNSYPRNNNKISEGSGQRESASTSLGGILPELIQLLQKVVTKSVEGSILAFTGIGIFSVRIALSTILPVDLLKPNISIIVIALFILLFIGAVFLIGRLKSQAKWWLLLPTFFIILSSGTWMTIRTMSYWFPLNNEPTIYVFYPDEKADTVKAMEWSDVLRYRENTIQYGGEKFTVRYAKSRFLGEMPRSFVVKKLIKNPFTIGYIEIVNSSDDYQISVRMTSEEHIRQGGFHHVSSNYEEVSEQARKITQEIGFRNIDVQVSYSLNHVGAHYGSIEPDFRVYSDEILNVLLGNSRQRPDELLQIPEIFVIPKGELVAAITFTTHMMIAGHQKLSGREEIQKSIIMRMLKDGYFDGSFEPLSLLNLDNMLEEIFKQGPEIVKRLLTCSSESKSEKILDELYKYLMTTDALDFAYKQSDLIEEEEFSFLTNIRDSLGLITSDSWRNSQRDDVLVAIVDVLAQEGQPSEFSHNHIWNALYSILVSNQWISAQNKSTDKDRNELDNFIRFCIRNQEKFGRQFQIDNPVPWGAYLLRLITMFPKRGTTYDDWIEELHSIINKIYQITEETGYSDVRIGDLQLEPILQHRTQFIDSVTTLINLIKEDAFLFDIQKTLPTLMSALGYEESIQVFYITPPTLDQFFSGGIGEYVFETDPSLSKPLGEIATSIFSDVLDTTIDKLSIGNLLSIFFESRDTGELIKVLLEAFVAPDDLIDSVSVEMRAFRDKVLERQYSDDTHDISFVGHRPIIMRNRFHLLVLYGELLRLSPDEEEYLQILDAIAKQYTNELDHPMFKHFVMAYYYQSGEYVEAFGLCNEIQGMTNEGPLRVFYAGFSEYLQGLISGDQNNYIDDLSFNTPLWIKKFLENHRQELMDELIFDRYDQDSWAETIDGTIPYQILHIFQKDKEIFFSYLVQFLYVYEAKHNLSSASTQTDNEFDNLIIETMGITSNDISR